MKYSLCTISFRHQLIGFDSLIQFANEHRYEGIELWGTHAYSLYTHDQDQTLDQVQKMQQQGINIPMISDYLDIDTNVIYEKSMDKLTRLIQLAEWFGAKYIRTFAGQKPSTLVSIEERKKLVQRLRAFGDRCKERGVHLLIETHPRTLADELKSALSLMHEINHENVGLNLDFLHLWENGADPVHCYHSLKPWVKHFHLKNISSTKHLSVFQPENVYSSNGNRDGMVHLGRGAIDYESIIREIAETDGYASLEWFGTQPLSVLREEARWLCRIGRSEIVG